MSDSEIVAFALSSIEGVKTTDDGKHALFKTKTASGAEHVLAVPEHQLMQLMILASKASGDCQKILQGDPQVMHVLPVERWSVGEIPDTQNVILTYRLPGNLEMSFQLHRDAAARMLETLQVHLNPTTYQKPEKPLN